MDNRLFDLPEELVELVFEKVHRDRYADVLAQLERESLRLLVRRLIQDVMEGAVQNVVH